MPYRVSYSGSVLTAFREAHVRAQAAGQGQDFLRVASEAHQQLQDDPGAFGDPLYSLRHLNLIVYARMVRPLMVRYAVNETEKVSS